MASPVSPNQISIVLTSTVDPKGIVFMQRADPLVRLRDYQQALQRWVEDRWVRNIIVVENSNYALDSLRDIASAARTDKNIEFLGFDGQDFPRGLGKGYGETLALTHVLQHSLQLRKTRRFLKINGRYFVGNLGKVLAGMSVDTQIYCNLNKRMTFSDSRFFGGDLAFLERVCVEGLRVNDQQGVWLEHALARSMLLGIADGLSWRFISPVPNIEGLSATHDAAYSGSTPKRWVKGRLQALKQRLMAW